MKSNPTLNDSRDWAKALHAVQTDKLGKPYIGHIERVVAHLQQHFVDFTEDQLHVAYLHDVIEDCGVTKSDFFDKGYKDKIVKTIELVTKPKGRMSNIDYEEWIRSLIASQNADAIRVKFSDMTDNFNKKRMSQLDTQERNKLNNKYARPYRMLVNAVYEEKT